MAGQGSAPTINFQGMMVGNAWTVAELDNTGAVTDWYTHSFISEDTWVGGGGLLSLS